MSGFQQYMDNTLQKINLENKEIYLAGDFNTYFLKIDTNNQWRAGGGGGGGGGLDQHFGAPYYHG